MLSKKITALVASGLLLASTSAAAQTASASSARSLSVAGAMQSGGEEAVGAGGPSLGVTVGVLLALVAAAALTFGDDGNDDIPDADSP